MEPLRLAVLGSGKGSNFIAIQRAIEDGEINARIILVVSDNPEAGILARAREFDLPAVLLPTGKYKTKLEPEIETNLAKLLLNERIELVVLAGYMRVVKAPLLDAFPDRIINIHPSLLPKFKGLEAWRQALEAGETTTGCTVHFVNADLDAGRIIAQREVPVLPDDTAESLHTRIQSAEHQLYPWVVKSLVGEMRTL
ncbi:MAG: phosphoribosylglycinamide formyltransferase [Verrucomicrobiota bacterium]